MQTSQVQNFLNILMCFRFYPRWKESEAVAAKSLHFSLDESQWQQDWAILLSIASQQGESRIDCIANMYGEDLILKETMWISLWLEITQHTTIDSTEVK